MDKSKKSGGINPLLIGLVVVVLLAAGGYVLWIFLVKRRKEKNEEPEGPAPVVMNGYLQKPTVGVAAARAIRPIRSNVAPPSSSRTEKVPSASSENASEADETTKAEAAAGVSEEASSEAPFDNTIPEMERQQEELQKKLDELSKEMEELPDLDSAFPEEGPKE